MVQRPALWLSVIGLFAGACVAPEPLSALSRRVDTDIQQRLNVPLNTDQLLADRPGPPQAPPAMLTLADARRLALEQNLTLSAAAESLPIAQLALVQAGLLTNPVISQSSGLLFPVSPTLGGAASFDINISQQLNSLFTRDARVAIAGVQRLEAGVDLASQAFELGMKVEEKYREILTLDGSVAIAERTEATYVRASESAGIRSRVGVLPMSEVNRAKVAAEDARRQVLKLRLRREQSVRDLNFLMGAPPDSAWTIPPVSDTEPSMGATDASAASGSAGLDDASVRTLATRFRLDVIRAHMDERAGEHSVRQAEAGLIPNINVGVESAYTPGHPSSTAVGPFFSVELPIFDSHRTALESARATLRKLQKTTAAVREQASADAAAAAHALELAVGDAAFYRDRIIPQQRENVRLAETAFQLGQIDLDSLLNTLRDATAAEQAYQDAIAARDAAQAALERAMGLSLDAARRAAVEPVDADPWKTAVVNTEQH
jgi:outer membrane protein TolC